jgi:hypothetical protein
MREIYLASTMIAVLMAVAALVSLGMVAMCSVGRGR